MAEQAASLPDFNIQPFGKISEACLTHHLTSFHEAITFIKHLPYGRNANKNDLSTLFADGCATCGTKHALLKQLALEHQEENIHLITGLFRMHGKNTPAVAETLQAHRLGYLPEVHCYLKFMGRRFDFTTANPKSLNFEPDLIKEKEILPDQITDYKVAYHKHHLAAWLKANPQLPYSLEELWTIREQCIQDLSK